MSNDQGPTTDPGEPMRWNPVVTVLMIILGFPLLLPGVCSYLFVQAAGGGGIAMLGFLIAFGGVAMIACGIRRLLKRTAAVPPAMSEQVKLGLLLLLFMICALIALLAAALLKR